MFARLTIYIILLFIVLFFPSDVFADNQPKKNNVYDTCLGYAKNNYELGNYDITMGYAKMYVKSGDNANLKEDAKNLLKNSEVLLPLSIELDNAILTGDLEKRRNLCEKILKINPKDKRAINALSLINRQPSHTIYNTLLEETKKNLFSVKNENFTIIKNRLNLILKYAPKSSESVQATAMLRQIEIVETDLRTVKLHPEKLNTILTKYAKTNPQFVGVIKEVIKELSPPDCKPKFDELIALANRQYGEGQFKKSVKNYIQAKNLHCRSNKRWIDDAIFYCTQSIDLLALIDVLENRNNEKSIDGVIGAYKELVYKYTPNSNNIKESYYTYCKGRLYRNPCGGDAARYSSIMESLNEKLYSVDGIKAILNKCNDSDTTGNCNKQYKQLDGIKIVVNEVKSNVANGNYSLAISRLTNADSTIKTLNCKSLKNKLAVSNSIDNLLNEALTKNNQKLCLETSKYNLFKADSLFKNDSFTNSFEILNNINTSCLNKRDSIRYNVLYKDVKCVVNKSLIDSLKQLNLESIGQSYESRGRDKCYFYKELVKLTCTKEDSLQYEKQYKDCRCENFRENCPPLPPVITKQDTSSCDTTTKFRVRFELFVGGSLGTFKPVYPLSTPTDDGYNTSFSLGKRIGVRVNLMNCTRILDLRIGINTESFYYTVEDSKLTFPSTTSSMSVFNGNIDLKFHTLPTCPSKIRYYIAPGLLISRYTTDAPKIPYLEDYTNRTFNDKIYGGVSLTLGLEKIKSGGKGYSIELFYNQLGTLHSKKSDTYLKPWDSSTAQINYIGIHIGAILF